MSTFYGRLRRLVVRGSTRLIGALTGTSATFSGSVSAGAGYLETVKAHGEVASGTESFSLADGSVHTVTATGDFTLATTGWPAAGTKGQMELYATNFGAHTVTDTITWVGGDPPWKVSGIDFATLISIDAGTTVYGFWSGGN